VATASTSVPPAVASAEMVVQSAIWPRLEAVSAYGPGRWAGGEGALTLDFLRTFILPPLPRCVPVAGRADTRGVDIRAGAAEYDLSEALRMPRRVAIFDLDRTLLPGSSLAKLGQLLVARRLVSRRLLARNALTSALFDHAGISDRRVDRVVEGVLAAVAGMEQAPLVDVAREAGAALAAATFPAARWLLDGHLDAGDFCIVLSAAPQELVESIVGALGAHRAIGTRATVRDGRYTGGLDGPFCHGPGKLTRLRAEAGPVDFARAIAYSDSASDIPLLAACGQAVAVNPDRRLRAHAVAAGWPIVRFE
jgi:HAD superfamily hydrolase (TIGR01490 family)